MSNLVPEENVKSNLNAELTESKSYFDGGVLGLLDINILTWLLTILTLGFAFPWAVCIKQNWLTQHTVIEGKRLTFDGSGIGLFGVWIKIFLLTIITLGIYGFWATITVRKWVVKHTHFA